jgi:hypothetical protein
MAANTVKANATAAATTPQDIAVSTNEFLARDSVSNLEAKTISDFAITLLTDTDAASMRTTLGTSAAFFEDDGFGNIQPVAGYAGSTIQPRSDGGEDLGTAALQWGNVETQQLNATTLTAAGLALLDDASAAAQRTTLGATAVGNGLFTAASALAARTTLGAGAVGDNLFTATTATAAQQAMDTEVGVDVQAYDATLQSLSGLGTAANKYAYTTGVDTWVEGDITAFGRSILDDANAAAVRTTLAAGAVGDTLFTANTALAAQQAMDTEVGVDVQAYDATLQSLSSLGTAANKIAYTTGVDTWAETNLTAFARTLLDDADASAMKTTLSIFEGWEDNAGNLRPVSAYTGDAIVPRTDGGEDLGTAALQWGDVQTQALNGTTLTAAGLALLDDANASAQLTTLGGTTVGKAVFTAASEAAARTAIGSGTVGDNLFTADTALAAQQAMNVEVGVDVQSYDALLDSIAGLSVSANKMMYFTGVDTAAVTDLTAFARTILDDADAGAVRTTISAASTTHQSTHNDGGSDALKLDDLATPDDNTDLDATSTRHGLLPKLSGTATQYLNGTGSWSTPSGGNTEFVSIDNTDSPYTNVAGNDGKVVLCDDSSGAITVNLQAAATAGDGYTVGFLKTSSSNYVLIDPNGSETVGGRSSGRLVSQYDFVLIRSDGTNWHIIGANYSPREVVYTSTGSNTFTTVNEVPLGCVMVKATVQAGGGGGGGGDTDTNSRGLGGSAGGASIEWIPVSSLGTTETATVGAGGSGGLTQSSPTAGSSGGTSSFGSFLSATGGTGGSAATGGAQGGLGGGSGSGGDINLDGGPSSLNPTGNGYSMSDGGVAPIFGVGQQRNIAIDAVGYGDGGACGNHTAGNNGGDGKGGIIILEML